MLRVLLFLALIIPLHSYGQSSIFRTTDEDGNVIFTDAPPAGTSTSEEVEIPPTNTVAPPALGPRPAQATAEDPTTVFEVKITSPANESTIAMGPGNFSVSASVSPEFKRGYSLQLFVDGAAHGEPQDSSSWDLTNVFRGGHDLTVGLIDIAGQTVATSETVRVYVLRPSINNPNRARPRAN